MKQPRRRSDSRVSVKPSDAESIVAGTEEQAETEHQPDSGRKVHRYQEKHRILARLVAENGTHDLPALMKQAGFGSSARPAQTLELIAELVESERARLNAGKSMTVEEAVQIVGDLARTTLDDRIKLGAVRTVLEVNEVIGRKSSEDRSQRNETTRRIDALMAELRKHPNMKRAIKSIESERSHAD